MAKGRKRFNLIGQKFTRALAIKPIPSTKKGGKIKWECLCDCGKIFIVSSTNDLISGNTKSCGCYRSDMMKKLMPQRVIDSVVKYEDPKIATARQVFDGDYADGNLTFEYFLELSQKNCHYCNKKPSNCRTPIQKKSSKFYIENCSFTYSGLDRVDNNHAHNFNNVVPCCWECNQSKRERTLKEFKNWIICVSNNLINKRLI